MKYSWLGITRVLSRSSLTQEKASTRFQCTSTRSSRRRGRDQASIRAEGHILYYLEVWRAAAPSIDFYSPDINWPNFEYWVERYEVARNPIFIPETQIEGAPYNVLYAYGEARAFGFSPFAIDSLKPPANDADPKPEIIQVYELLDSMRDLLPTAQAEGLTRGMVLHTTSPRPTRTVALGGYLFEATLSRSWPSRTIAADNGAMLILRASPAEFYIV